MVVEIFDGGDGVVFSNVLLQIRRGWKIPDDDCQKGGHQGRVE